jgi:tRNA pseudouridine65 synthase
METSETDCLEILYKDKDLVAVNKPSGLMVHKSPLATGEKRFALQMVRNQTGSHVFPVHRLDRPTSGVLLFARNRETAAGMAKLFELSQIQKSYLAVVRGHVEGEGTICHPLKNIKHKIDSKKTDAQPRVDEAITEFLSLARVELPVAVDRYPTTRYSLVKLWPKTGRRHQLRRHMKHIFHPIVGDTVYGKSTHNRFFENHLNCKGLLLTARELSFIHPGTREPITISAPLEDRFRTLITRLGWDQAVAP